MSTLAEIRARVLSIVIDQTAAVLAAVDDEIRSAQRRAEDRHGFWVMETGVNYTTTEDDVNLGSKPSLYARRMDQPFAFDGLGGVWPLEMVSTVIETVKSFDLSPLTKGRPQLIEEKTDEFLVYPKPDNLAPAGPLFSDGNYRIRVPYYKREATLSADLDTNWFSENAADYLTWRAAQELLDLNRDNAEMLKYTAKAEGELRRLIRDDKKARFAKDFVLRPRRDVQSQFRQVRM